MAGRKQRRQRRLRDRAERSAEFYGTMRRAFKGIARGTGKDRSKALAEGFAAIEADRRTDGDRRRRLGELTAKQHLERVERLREEGVLTAGEAAAELRKHEARRGE